MRKENNRAILVTLNLSSTISSDRNLHRFTHSSKASSGRLLGMGESQKEIKFDEVRSV